MTILVGATVIVGTSAHVYVENHILLYKRVFFVFYAILFDIILNGYILLILVLIWRWYFIIAIWHWGLLRILLSDYGILVHVTVSPRAWLSLLSWHLLIAALILGRDELWVISSCLFIWMFQGQHYLPECWLLLILILLLDVWFVELFLLKLHELITRFALCLIIKFHFFLIKTEILMIIISILIHFKSCLKI